MDIDKVNKIISDLELLIKNIDPKTKKEISVDTILNNSYNKQLLKNVKAILSEYASKVSRKKYKIKEVFQMSLDMKEKVCYSNSPIVISAFTYELNKNIDSSKIKKIKATDITRWLVVNGYLAECDRGDGKFVKVLTDKSSCIGLMKENRISKDGREYEVVLYSKESQQFIVNNINEIAECTIE
ncbi:MAG: hypothetical protein RR945_07620 [Erysipelotrichaceae bacterium]|uniref:hypothetical protein n=1 Tax=Anaerorhabdus sp. TaxID=1872524 RepID=UPI002FC9CCD9